MNVKGVKHWLADLKLPLIHHNHFRYIKFNGHIIHDINNKKYRFNAQIDDKIYYDDLRPNLIKQIEDEHNIQGVCKWFEDFAIPFKHQDRFERVIVNGVEIYNKNNRNYRFTIKIDGVEYNSNSKMDLINELENECGFKNVSMWFNNLRLSKSESKIYNEVIINGKTIHPRKVRGFL